eukprot:TRINITY_DN1923_c0_g1_i1.p1 TRINITY_DN1923_c0_g1~~TRINITY_DN1923_c0_g1_i1.p1  ORF type:complete len:583 (+),score=161.37 TRINITY_DN1923_c0_g1_i1:336-2084(+)
MKKSASMPVGFRPVLSPSTKSAAADLQQMIDVLPQILKETSAENRRPFLRLLLAVDNCFRKGESPLLISFFNALNESVSSIDQVQHKELIHFLLGRFVWTSSAEVMEAFKKFLLNLVSAHGNLITICLEFMIRNFNSGAKFDNTEVVPLNKDQLNLMWTRTHEVLQSILNLVPSASARIPGCLSRWYPAISIDTASYVAYLENFLQLIEYLPSVRDQVLDIFVARMIDLDVSINIDESPDEEELLFEVEFSENNKKGEDDAEKLDAMLGAMYNYIDRHFDDEVLFQQLLRVFDTKILPTFKAKYLQFLVFYITSKQGAFCSKFIEYLSTRLVDPNSASATRQACAAYIGSYAARANFLPDELLRWTLEIVVKFAINHMETKQPQRPDEIVHAVFYSACHAIFYMVCFLPYFRGQSGKLYFEKLEIERLITSKLNPLKFCSPGSVEQFAAVAQNLGISCVDEVVKRNINMGYAIAAKNRANILSDFFPFDPYLLKNSSQKINPLYRSWKSASSIPSSTQEQSQDDDTASDMATSLRRDSIISPSTSVPDSSFVDPSPLNISAMSMENTSQADLTFYFQNVVEV